MKINTNLMLGIFSLIFSLLFVNCGKEDNTREDSISSTNPNSSTEDESKNGAAKTVNIHSSLEAKRESEKNRLKAEEAFYSNFGKKTLNAQNQDWNSYGYLMITMRMSFGLVLMKFLEASFKCNE